MKRILKLWVLMLGLSVAGLSAWGATVTTDQSDYSPGATAIITGAGFAPGESVQVQVLNLSDPSDTGPEHDPWTVSADSSGNFTTSWFVTSDEGGATLQVTAKGLTSGLTAQETFTDSAGVASATIGSASGTTTYGTSNSVTYTMTIVANGSGNGSSTPTISGLPAGVTAVFNPATINLRDVNSNPGNSTNVTLTLTTSNNTPAGTTTFTVTAQPSPLITATNSLTVNAKVLTALGTLSVPSSKVYNGTTTASPTGAAALQTAEAFGTGSTGDGKPYSGDTVSLTGTASYTYNSKDVASATTVSESGLSLTGAQSANYTLTAPSFSATITAKALTYSGPTVPSSKIYNGNTTAVVSGSAALQATEAAGAGTTADGKPYSVDSASLTGTVTGTYNSKDVSSATTVTFGGASLTGTGSGNYSLTALTQAATITTKALTYSGPTVPSSKVYNGSTVAVVTGSAALQATEAAGAGSTADGKPYSVDSASLTGTVTGTYNSKDVSGATTVTFSGVSLTGTGSGNYSLTTLTQSATITALAVSLTGTRAYDATTTVAFGILSVANKVGADTVSVASGSGTLASASAGSRAITSFGTLALGNNAAGDYTLSGASGSVTISAAATAVTLVSSLNPSGFNTSVNFTSTVPTIATGNITFLTNGTALSTNTVASGSAASAATTVLPRGTNVITAIYNGDGNNLASTNTLNQVVTNHLPTATVLTVNRPAGVGFKVAVSQLATHWSDVDGDTVTLLSVASASTNGVNITTNSGFIFYTNGPSVADQINYTILDGHGGTNTGVISVTIQATVTGTNSISSIVHGNPTTVAAFGIPGYTYVTQRSTNTITWVDISTNTVATNGALNVSDNFSDLGGVPPTTAYYRLRWIP